MWKLKQFMPQERNHTSLEGRTIDVGSVKVAVREPIAEGGFSCVYLARDISNPAKQYALKHVIVQDKETMDLVTKEIMVMRSLKGHPNIVPLLAHAVMDVGRLKEAVLLMEHCEKTLVSVLEGRGTAGYFSEKQVLSIFRDVCNGVLAMHCQSPPLAHRDLKAENVLLSADGAWKLCDFGSISTNHKRFERPEEMGIEEDNIRKHTTPAYRAPEMWDLYRKDVISEKVDIWALGCLLYKICFLKSAFDGESKLQILNGNYRIPELPKYSSPLKNLIKDMLNESPDARPDVTQVWFRVNELLPLELQKDLPDGPSSEATLHVQPPKPKVIDEVQKKTSMPPRRSPPPPPSTRENVRTPSPQEACHSSSSHGTSNAENKGSVGSFWATQYAQDATLHEKGTLPLEEQKKEMVKRHPKDCKQSRNTLPCEHAEDVEITFSPNGSERIAKAKSMKNDANVIQHKSVLNNMTDVENDKVAFRHDAMNLNKISSMTVEELEDEVHKLKEELKIATMEKEVFASKYEKLSAICSSQRQEIQDLKDAIARAAAVRESKDSPDHVKTEIPAVSSQCSSPPREKIEGTPKELQGGLLTNASAMPVAYTKPTEDLKVQPSLQSSQPRSVRTVRTASANRTSSNAKSTSNSAASSWAFGEDSFKAFGTGSDIPKSSNSRSASPHFDSEFGDVKKQGANQPSGWTGF